MGLEGERWVSLAWDVMERKVKEKEEVGRKLNVKEYVQWDGRGKD